MLCKHGNMNYQDNYRVISKRYAVIELSLAYFKSHFIGNPCYGDCKVKSIGLLFSDKSFVNVSLRLSLW